MKSQYDAVIIGAGASGLMCAAQAGVRGRRVKVLDHARQPGRKILMSGGGRCNFTNREVTAENYISSNPHFVKSALSRYQPRDFIALARRHGIRFSEREHGQLFCTDSAKEILSMLVSECRRAGVVFGFNTNITGVEQMDANADFRIRTAGEKSIPHPLSWPQAVSPFQLQAPPPLVTRWQSSLGSLWYRPGLGLCP